jgi:hypothetical protein
MAQYCVPKDKMKALLIKIKSLDGGIGELVDMGEKRIDFFKSVLGNDANKLDATLERALMSENKRALGNWLKKNVDETTKARAVSTAQKASLNKYLIDNLVPSPQGKSAIVTPAKIAEMGEKERGLFLRKFYPEEKVAIIEERLAKVKAIKKEQEALAQIQKENSSVERELKAQRDKVEKILSGKKQVKTSKRISSNEIMKMKDGERLSYLKSLGIKNADKINQAITAKRIEREILREVSKKESLLARRVKSQERIIENFLADNKEFRPRVNKNMDEILEMGEKERLAFLEKIVKNPEEINKKIEFSKKTSFERQVKKDLGAMTNYRELKAYREGKVNEIVTNTEKVNLTPQEEATIMKFGQKLEEQKVKFETSGLESDRADYGRMLMEYRGVLNKIVAKDYTKGEVATGTLGLMRTLLTTGEFSSVIIQGFPYVTRLGGELLLGGGKLLFGVAKAPATLIKISTKADYRKAFFNAFRAMGDWRKGVKGFGDVRGYNEVMGEYLTRDTASARREAGLRQSDITGKLSQREEDFLTLLFDKMEAMDSPIFNIIGRVGNRIFQPFSAFHSAYLTGLRVESFDATYKKMLGTGITITKKDKQYLASIINDATGGSTLGSLEAGAQHFSQVFFSARHTLGTIKMLGYRPFLDSYRLARGTKAEKMIAKESLKNVAYLAGTGLGLMSLFSMAQKEGVVEVEWNPTATDFGDVKFNGKTRVNLFGGRDWLITLAARMVMNEQKTQSGLSLEYGTGFGQLDRLDQASRALRSKFAPTLSLFADFLAGSNVIGDKFLDGATREDFRKAFLEGDEGAMALIKGGAQKEAFNRLVPITYQSLLELYEENPELGTALTLPALFGASTNTYAEQRNWIQDSTQDGTKELIQFRQKLGYEKTLEAQELYNKRINEELEKVKGTSTYKALEDEEKAKKLQATREKVKKEVFAKYLFTYQENYKPQ